MCADSVQTALDFDWDPNKHDVVYAERGFSFADAVAIFGGPVLGRRDHRRDYVEERYIAVGYVEADFFTVVYTDRKTVRWIITAWKSSRKERAAWRRSRSPTP